jgi:phosphoglycolate phosphatase
MSFDLVLFDLDGTLVETAPEITDAINELFGRLRLPRVEQRDVERWVGFGERRTLELALQSSDAGRRRLERGIDAQLLHEFDEAYFAHCGRRSRVYPHVTELLCALGAAGLRRAVISNKEQRLAMKVLEAHGLADDLELIVCGDTLAARKPDPLPVRHCLEHFGLARDRAVLIGDSQIDVATARAAGIAVWAVTYGYNLGRPVADAKPDRLLKSFAELGPLLLGAPLPSPSPESSTLVV